MKVLLILKSDCKDRLWHTLHVYFKRAGRILRSVEVGLSWDK